MKEVGTLKELDIRPGDVVVWDADPDIHETVVSAEVVAVNSMFPGQIRAKLSSFGWGIFNNEKFTVISRASDTPKTWGEMSDAEKGALLLAQHEGKEIEYMGFDRWWPKPIWEWSSEKTYRIKPEPKRETVTLYGDFEDGGHVSLSPYGAEQYRITFDTLDGKPVLDSIKMEEL